MPYDDQKWFVAAIIGVSGYADHIVDIGCAWVQWAAGVKMPFSKIMVVPLVLNFGEMGIDTMNATLEPCWLSFRILGGS